MLYPEARLLGSGEALPIEVPSVYAIAVDRARLRPLLVLEDIRKRDGLPNCATDPLDVEAVGRGLDAPARFHGRFWGFSPDSKPARAWVPALHVTLPMTLLVAMGSRVGISRKTNPSLTDSLPATLRDWRQITRLWAPAIRASASGEITLLDGVRMSATPSGSPTNDRSASTTGSIHACVDNAWAAERTTWVIS
jgi:hypothetical protein